jgi:hypothetical protein
MELAYTPRTGPCTAHRMERLGELQGFGFGVGRRELIDKLIDKAVAACDVCPARKGTTKGRS